MATGDVSSNELAEVAWHESGHAVAAIVLGFEVRSVGIDEDWCGCVESTASDVTVADDPDMKRRSAVVALSGRASRRVVSADDSEWSELETSDQRRAELLVGEAGAMAAAHNAEELVTTHRGKVARLVSRLLELRPPFEIPGCKATSLVQEA
jgi:hypothetical protein